MAPSGIALNGISCSNDTTCLATGSHVIDTTNGGSHWNDLGTPAGSTALTSVSCISSSTCTAVGGTSILSTTDGGVAWTDLVAPFGVGSLSSVSCVTPANCVATGAASNFGGTIETLSAPPSVTTTGLSLGTIGVPYTGSLAASGGLAPYSWSVASGALPPGMVLDPNGTITGTPTISGQYPVTFSVTDANFLSSDAALVISIRPIAAPGYWEVASDGGIFSYGGAQFYGSTGSLQLNAPIVGMAATPDDAGYWLLASDGGIFAFGDAIFYGSTGGMRLNAPIVAMAPTPDGAGYWLVASDGGVFAFGDATFFGSAGSIPLVKPIVGMASTIDGLGYWLVSSDGGIFTYGDAPFSGSVGGLPLPAPIVAMTSAPGGGGYWLAASDGGLFNFGGVTYYGSPGGMPLSAPIVGMDRTADGQGYWMVGRDGGIFSFGDAGFFGSTGGLKLNRPVVGMAAIQSLSAGQIPSDVHAGPGELPQVTQQPLDQTVAPGDTATFHLVASGEPTPAVQWQKSTDEGRTFTDIAGATSAILSVTSVDTGEQWYRYRAVLDNVVGSVTSASAALVVGGEPVAFSPPLLKPDAAATQPQARAGATVFPTETGAPAALPEVMEQPLDQTIASGGNATFTALASAEPMPLVQWQVSTDGGKSFSDIAGANDSSLTLSSAAENESLDRYRAVFTNSAGSDTSASARVVIAP